MITGWEGNLHELWTWAVGKPGYDKAAWVAMQNHLALLAAYKGGPTPMDSIYIQCCLKKGEGGSMHTWQVSDCPSWALEELRIRIEQELADRRRIRMIAAGE